MAKNTLGEIIDFGEKIGGARKDLFRQGGITVDDLRFFNDAEIRKFVTRDNVWPFQAVQLVNRGAEPFIVYVQQKIRRYTYGAPQIRLGDEGDVFSKKVADYVNALRDFSGVVMSLKTETDINVFFERLSSKNHAGYEKWRCCMNYSTINRLRFKLRSFKTDCVNSGYPFKKRSSGKRKKAFIPPQLDHIERDGPNFRRNLHVNANVWQDTFSFRGIEFGNWLSQKERQMSMDYCYDALKDLAVILDIADKDIAFDGKLALAFGARGTAKANAHYEPLREVINLTKMHGAGCTAHEWMHAMDDRLAKICGIKDGKLASETGKTDVLPKSFLRLVKALQTDADGNSTDFYRGSKIFDKAYAKDAHGYWASAPEMLARAFACYCKDTLGYKSDYLFAHADVYVFEFEDMRASAIPQGEEREILNELFDSLFIELKDIGFFNERLEDIAREGSFSVHGMESGSSMALVMDAQGQFSFTMEELLILS